MSLKVSIDHVGRHSVTVESDRKKRSHKDHGDSKRSSCDLREMISKSSSGREERGMGDLRDRLEKVRGHIAEYEDEYQKNGGNVGKKDSCEISDNTSQHNLSLYSDEKNIDAKGKENSKDDISDVTKAAKEKSLASEWGQRKKKKKKRSRSRSKERKPLSDKDYDNRKRKHAEDAEVGKDVSKSKKEKRRSTSRDHEERKKKKDKKKKRSPTRSRSRDNREVSARKSRIDSGISISTTISKESVSPNDALSPAVPDSPVRRIKYPCMAQTTGRSLSPKNSKRSPARRDKASPRKDKRSPRKELDDKREPTLSPSPSPPRRVLARTDDSSDKSDGLRMLRSVSKEKNGFYDNDKFKDQRSDRSKDRKSYHEKDRKDKEKSRKDSKERLVKNGRKSPEKARRNSEDRGRSEEDQKYPLEKDQQRSPEQGEPTLSVKEGRSPVKDPRDSMDKEREESLVRDQRCSAEKERSQDRAKSREKSEKNRNRSQERDRKDRRVSRERDRRNSHEKESKNPYSVYEEKHGRRRSDRDSRRRSRDRSRDRCVDLKDEVARIKRERQRRSRSRSQGRYRGSRRVNDDHYRRGRESRYGGREHRRRRYSGDIRRSSDRQDSWEDKVESFLQNTSSNSLSVVPLLPQDFDPSKPPPMVTSSVVPPDYALTEYRDPILATHDPNGPASAIRQLMDVSTGQIIPQSGLHPPPTHISQPLPGILPQSGLVPPPDPYSVLPPSYPTIDFPPPEMSQPPPNYVQTDITTFSKEPQVNANGVGDDYKTAEAEELARMNQLHEENAKNRKEKESDKPLTVKEKKKAEKAQKELWQFVAKKLLGDPIFCLKAKKKKSKSIEELKEKSEKCSVRIALALEKAGFSEVRLWKMVKDNEKGIQGFSAELSSAVMNSTIETDVDARSPKHRLDAELLKDGAVFKYIGQYIQGNPANSGRKSTTPDKTELPSNDELQSILKQSQVTSSSSPPEAPQMGPTLPTAEDLHPHYKADHESDWDFSNRSFAQLQTFFESRSVPKAEAESYCRTLVRANFHYLLLRETVTNFQPPEPLNEGDPPETLYGHLLDCLREISFDKYPENITKDIDGHTRTIVKLVLEHFTPQPVSNSTSEVATVLPKQQEADIVPIGGNTGIQLPPKKYVTMAVSVETIPVEGRLAVWQISLHTPELPEAQDPDYECLMVPNTVPEPRLTEAGFMYNQEKGVWYHQGTEFGRRKAESEEKSIENLVNYLEELRGGGREAGLNNGLVLLFESTEDFSLVRSLLSSHSADIWSDTVRGVGCIDHFVRAADIQAVYCPPYFKNAVGEDGQWVTTLYRTGKKHTIVAETRSEIVFNILETVLGTTPKYDNFLRWYCYPSLGDTAILMARDLELIRQMLPLQTHVDRQLFNTRVQCVLEGVYAPRSELETRQPCACVARQAVRRLVSLGFNLDNLKNSFRADPNYEIPANVFLQDMTQVQRLRVHTQTDSVRKFIKEYFTPNYYNRF